MFRIDPEPPLVPYEPPMPCCPVCGEETDTFFRDRFNSIIGCDMCVDSVDAYDWVEENGET